MPALTWTAVGNTSGGTLQNISGGFAWWFGRVYVDPVNPQHVFVAGVNLAESLNGGLNWTTSNAVHADQHGLECDPFTPGKVFLGNDGGFYWSTVNGAARGLWSKTPRLPVTQFYAMDVSVQDGSRVNAGSQDNGSLKSWTSTTPSPATGRLLSGDGMMNRINPTNDRRYYACSQNGGCRGFAARTPRTFGMTIPGRARTGWPRSSSPPTRRILFGASEFVYRIEHRGRRSAHVAADQLGPHRGHRAPRAGLRHDHGARARRRPIQTSSSRHRQRSDVGQPERDGAPDLVTWRSSRAPCSPAAGSPGSRSTRRTPKVAWATFSGWRSGDGYPHIVMTSDGGNTWVDIAGKRIPQAPINDVIRHQSKPKWLFIATDVGVFRTTNLGKTWLRWGPTCRSCRSTTSICRPAARRSTRRHTVAASGRRRWPTPPELSLPRPWPPCAVAGEARSSKPCDRAARRARRSTRAP